MEEIKTETIASEETVKLKDVKTKGGKTKIPPAAVAYIISGLWSIVSLFLSLLETKQAESTIFSVFVSLAVSLAVTICIVKNKKNIGLFFLFLISSAASVIGLLTRFNVGGLLSCLGTILLMLIVGTATVPQLEKFKGIAKKIYFVPALLILASTIITNLLMSGSLQHIMLVPPVYTFVNFFMSPVVTLLFASWCLKSLEEISGKNRKDKAILIVFIIFLVVAILASAAMRLSAKGSSNSSSSSGNYSSSSSSGNYGGSSSSGNYGGSSSSGNYGGSSSSDKQYGAGGYEMPNENDDSFADYVQRVDPDLYDAMEDRYNDAVDDYNGNSYNNSYNSSSSDKQYGAGGYEMPNENDDSFADYVQRVDPDLYDAMEDNYNSAVGGY